MKINLWPYLIASAVLCACATVGNPTGGEKDTDGPLLITNKSSQNLKTNETSREWTFRFNEFVKISQAQKNVIVSPPLRYPLDIKIKGKSVEVKLDNREELLPQTTYIINFGRAVQDITEGNPSFGLRHVFSTGSSIDSLSLKGQLISAIDGADVSQIPLLLYDDLSDTAFYTNKPLYLIYSDSSGYFNLDYLRSDTFALFALKDENGNLIYDGPPEQIAFIPDHLIIDSQSLLSLPLILFEEEENPEVEDYSFKSGLLEAKLERAFYDTPEIRIEGLDLKHLNIKEDIIQIWYDGVPKNNTLLIFDYPESSDTSRIRYLKTKDIERSWKIVSQGGHDLDHTASFVVELDCPVRSVNPDSSYINIGDSLLPTAIFELIDPLHFRCTVDQLVRDSGAILSLGSGTLVDFLGETHDTTDMLLVPYRPEKRANLSLNFIEIDSTMNYLVELEDINGKNQLRFTIEKQSNFLKELRDIEPIDRVLTIVEDRDKNGRRTSGNLELKRYPEKVFTETLGPIKPNWDLKLDIKPVF